MQSFNLVIEVLLISSLRSANASIVPSGMFQSRNRGSFDFKLGFCTLPVCVTLEFQSRNRGSFDFKTLFSGSYTDLTNKPFQSRNRGSFDFKVTSVPLLLSSTRFRFNLVIEGSFDFKTAWACSCNFIKSSFNLVIEVLLISRVTDSKSNILTCENRFNLVIEVLLISSVAGVSAPTTQKR